MCFMCALERPFLELFAAFGKIDYRGIIGYLVSLSLCESVVDCWAFLIVAEEMGRLKQLLISVRKNWNKAIWIDADFKFRS